MDKDDCDYHVQMENRKSFWAESFFHKLAFDITYLHTKSAKTARPWMQAVQLHDHWQPKMTIKNINIDFTPEIQLNTILTRLLATGEANLLQENMFRL